MSDDEIEILKTAVRSGRVLWNPDSHVAREVVAIGAPPKPEDGDEPEPSECAYFHNREYVALYNCPLFDFCTATRLGREIED